MVMRTKIGLDIEISDEFVSLINGMLNPDPFLRLSIENIKSHIFIKKEFASSEENIKEFEEMKAENII